MVTGGRSFQWEGRPRGSWLSESWECHPTAGVHVPSVPGLGVHGSHRETPSRHCDIGETCDLVRAQTSCLGPQPPSSSKSWLCSREGGGGGGGWRDIVPTSLAGLLGLIV